MQRAEPPSPRRFHVLLVGTDQETERLIRIQLIHSYYQITPHRTFNSALEFFEKEKFGVDLVLSDVSLKVEEGSNSFEDGYDFIEQIQLLRKNIPHLVIFGAERLVHHDVTRAYKLGACHFLKKPISEGSDEIGNLWQHIFRWRARNEDFWQHVIRWRAHNDGSSSLVSSQQENLKRGYEFMNHGEEPPLRKQRLVWTEELDSLFVEVVNYLGKKHAVPKRILEEMKKHRPELSLTRGQVGSHLQKHWEKEKKKQLPQPRMNIANGWNVMTVNQIPPIFDFHLPENSTINSLPHPPLSQMQNPHYNQQRIFARRKYNLEYHEQHLACPPKQLQQLW
ncbi:hypothetical protein K1719_016555 [Acacia pycnantha]|nr:hypothetical protein K1719_016555 [Acacia pycnantha]